MEKELYVPLGTKMDAQTLRKTIIDDLVKKYEEIKLRQEREYEEALIKVSDTIYSILVDFAYNEVTKNDDITQDSYFEYIENGSKIKLIIRLEGNEVLKQYKSFLQRSKFMKDIEKEFQHYHYQIKWYNSFRGLEGLSIKF